MNRKLVIGLAGGPCTGKTDLAAYVHKKLDSRGIAAAWAREFASHDIPHSGPPAPELALYEQFRYNFYQLRAEEEALRQADIVLTDAPVFMGSLYALLQRHSVTDSRQKRFIEEFEFLFRQDATRYDMIYLLRRDRPLRPTADTIHGQTEARRFDVMLRNMLTSYDIPHRTLGGPMEEQGERILTDIFNLCLDEIDAPAVGEGEQAWGDRHRP